MNKLHEVEIEVEKDVIVRKPSLQEAILKSVEGVVNAVDNTDKQVSYEVFNTVEKVSIFGKETVTKTHIKITITDALVDTAPKKI